MGGLDFNGTLHLDRSIAFGFVEHFRRLVCCLLDRIRVCEY